MVDHLEHSQTYDAIDTVNSVFKRLLQSSCGEVNKLSFYERQLLTDHQKLMLSQKNKKLRLERAFFSTLLEEKRGTKANNSRLMYNSLKSLSLNVEKQKELVRTYQTRLNEGTIKRCLISMRRTTTKLCTLRLLHSEYSEVASHRRKVADVALATELWTHWRKCTAISKSRRLDTMSAGYYDSSLLAKAFYCFKTLGPRRKDWAGKLQTFEKLFTQARLEAFEVIRDTRWKAEIVISTSRCLRLKQAGFKSLAANLVENKLVNLFKLKGLFLQWKKCAKAHVLEPRANWSKRLLVMKGFIGLKVPSFNLGTPNTITGRSLL